MGMAAAMIPFAGCQKNEMEDPNAANGGGSTFELVADVVQTKTTLDASTYKVAWENDDVLYVVTAGEGTPWTAAQEFKYADGKFSTESTIDEGNYTMNVLYAASNQKQYHKNTQTTHKIESVQKQDCTNPTVHIKLNDALAGTFTVNVPQTSTAQVDMHHLYTLMQVNVKNNTGNPVKVTKFEMTAEGANLAGVFKIDSFDPISITYNNAYGSNKITVELTGGTVAADDALPVYFVMAPLKEYSGNITFVVTDSDGKTYSKTIAASNITFAAGTYNTTPYTISVADKVPQYVTWDLSKDETSEATPDKIAWTSAFAEMYSERVNSSATPANNYYPGNSQSSTRFYKSNKLTISPKEGYVITSAVFSATTSDYATALGNSTWTNASASVSSTTVTVTPSDVATSMVATIGGTCGFKSVVVYYELLEGYVPPVLESISISGEYKTEFTQGDDFVFGGAVTAYYDNNTTKDVTKQAVFDCDLNTVGEKEVTVSYTENEVTKTTAYTVTVSERVVDDTDYSGQYIIVAEKSNKYYYMSTLKDGNLSGNNRSAIDSGVSEISDYESSRTDFPEVDESCVWNVTKVDAGYKFENLDRTAYLYTVNDNRAHMGSTTNENASSIFNISVDDHVYTVSDTKYERTLSLNTSSNLFACYTSGQIRSLVFIPYVPDTTPKIKITSALEQTIGAEGGELTFNYELKNLEGKTLTATPSVGYLTASVSSNVVTVTVQANETTEERTATITFACEGAESKIVTVKQAAAEQGGGDEVVVKTFTVKSDDVVNNSAYQKYTATIDNRGWLITCGGNQKSVGVNSKNRSKCTLSSYNKYAVSPVTTSAVASAFASTTSISNVTKISYGAITSGKYQTSTKVYVLYSADGNTFSQISLTSGSQGEKINASSGGSFEFAQCTGYFVVLFESTTTSGDWRLDDVNITFTYND